MRVDTVFRGTHGFCEVAISLTSQTQGKITLVRIGGRLDSHGAMQAEPELQKIRASATVVLEMSGVDYLSSGGLRIFVALYKKLASQGGRLTLAALQPYCKEVLRVSGMKQLFAITDTLEEAMSGAGDVAEVLVCPCGKFVFHKGADEAGNVEVLGRLDDVLNARITPERMWAKRFSAKEYSLGLGALGPDVESVMPCLGEMATMGGTMVWLPTDGNDTPDLLVPRHDSDEVVIRTGFNISIKGRFNEYIEFEAESGDGATLAEVYRALFTLARERRPDYRGALALAMRAEIGQAYGCGMIQSPIPANAPTNGLPLTDVSNHREWFEMDEVPRHRDITGLICGVGLDLGADLSVFDREHLGAAFSLEAGDGAAEVLYNQGVFFRPFPLGERPLSLEREIKGVVEEGEFVDMRRLSATTTIQWALIGVVYVQDFQADSASLSPE